MTPTERAQKLGTLNAIDRSPQYSDATQIDLLRSLNEAWSKIRRLESANIQKDAVIAALQAKVRTYRVGNTALIAIITGLAWEGLKALVHLALTR